MADSVNAKSVDNSENPHTMLSINKGGNALLQTARGITINKENQNLKRNIRILFYSGSQKSFINESLSKELRFPIKRSEKKVLNPFEGQNEELREFNIINATIMNRHFKNPVETELIVVRNICSPISHQTIEVAKTTHDHLRDLALADFNNNGGNNLNIDILIGGDFY